MDQVTAKFYHRMPKDVSSKKTLLSNSRIKIEYTMAEECYRLSQSHWVLKLSTGRRLNAQIMMISRSSLRWVKEKSSLVPKLALTKLHILDQMERKIQSHLLLWLSVTKLTLIEKDASNMLIKLLWLLEDLRSLSLKSMLKLPSSQHKMDLLSWLVTKSKFLS